MWSVGRVLIAVLACVVVIDGMRTLDAHSMSIYNPCQLTSVSCCNGMNCPHADATCCPDGRHCCPKNSVCLPGSPGSPATCGFPVKLRPPVSTDNVNAASLQPQPQPQPIGQASSSNNNAACNCGNTAATPPPPTNCNCNKQSNSIYQDAQIAPMFAQPQQRNPLAVEIEKLASVEQIIPPSLVDSYNHLIAPVNITIRLLGYNLDDFPIGSPQRNSWSRQLVRDVAFALNIPDQQVKILSLTSGSIIASLSIQKPVDGSSNRLPPFILANQFQNAIQDANSYVYFGRITKYIDKNYFIQDSKYIANTSSSYSSAQVAASSSSVPTATSSVDGKPRLKQVAVAQSKTIPQPPPSLKAVNTVLKQQAQPQPQAQPQAQTQTQTAQQKIAPAPVSSAPHLQNEADRVIMKELSGKDDPKKKQ